LTTRCNAAPARNRLVNTIIYEASNSPTQGSISLLNDNHEGTALLVKNGERVARIISTKAPVEEQ
jgi:hypothetical protein